MAAALAQQIRDAGEALPARLVLLSPWMDVTMTDPGQRAIEPDDPFLSIAPARMTGEWYAAGLALDDPRVSPIHGAMAGLPPMMVLTGTRDLLNADAHRLRDKAAAEGVALTFVEAPAMIHVWMLMPIPEARRALDRIAGFITS